MVEQNQVIAHDDHGAFILLIGERLLQLFLKMSFCDEFYGQRRIFNRNICAVFQQPEALLLVLTLAVGNRKDASPGISAADKLPDYRLGNEAADAAGEQEGKGKFLAVSDFHDVLPKLAILVVDASYAVNAKEQQSKFYVLAMLGIIKEAACQIIGCFVFRFSCVAGHERVAVGGKNLPFELFVESTAVCLRGFVYIVLHQLDEIHRDRNI